MVLSEMSLSYTATPVSRAMKPTNKHLNSDVYNHYQRVECFTKWNTSPVQFRSLDNSQNDLQDQIEEVKEEDVHDIALLLENMDEERFVDVDAPSTDETTFQPNLEVNDEITFENISDEDLVMFDPTRSSESMELHKEYLEQSFEESLDNMFSEIIDEDLLCPMSNSLHPKADIESSFDDDWVASDEVEAELIEISSSAKVYEAMEELVDEEKTVIVRPPFPKLAKDKSPIAGLSTETIVQTCFRTGEALNAGAKALKRKKHIILEIYAFVVSSYREACTNKQHFVLGDLFNDNAPHLNGVYEVWKGVDLWEHDSSAFIAGDGGKRICRCMARVKREGKKWKLVILNVWEATWDDVEHVRGIICA